MVNKTATLDQRIDLYIQKSAPFAQEILGTLRNRVHDCCPVCVETLKWGMPHFLYKGKILCSMAAFKNHCAFGFWLASKMKDAAQFMETDENRSAMGDLGKLTRPEDLPDQITFRMLIQEAMYLIDQGVSPERKAKADTPSPQIPEELTIHLAENPAALLFFDSISAAQKREYLNWILEAKTEGTRSRRIQTTVDWCAQGKRRNWKYEKG